MGRMMMTLAVAALMVALLAGAAQAHDHRIPKTVLMKETKELQTGHRVIESYWASATADGLCESFAKSYTFELLDGSGFNYPEMDRVAAGSELRVRISKAQRPDSFSVAAYPTIDEHGKPSGEARLLKRSLERVVVDGKTVAWDAKFSVNRPSRDYYLIAKGHWQDREGCNADQYAHWSFHIKTRA
jgi:hypothetical protein